MTTTTTETPLPIAGDYEHDFHAWLLKNAELLRQHRFTELDAANLAEEFESMGKRERQALISRLAVLLMHLLKWRYQPNRRGDSWKYTIIEQRRVVLDAFQESPSLRANLPEYISKAYGYAILKAVRQTGFDERTFPPTCPFTVEQILDENDWPK